MFDGVAGTTAVTLTAKRTAAAAPMPARPSRPSAKRSAQQAASWIAQAPSWAALAAMPRRGSRKTARPARTWISARWTAAPIRAMRPLPLRRISTGATSTTTSRISGTRLKRKICLVLSWKSGVVETMITPSIDQGDDVQHRLRDQGPEQDREGFAHAAGSARERQGAGGLAEAGRQGRRHQHPDHRRRGDVAAADRPVGQRRAGDPVPGGGAEEERDRHQRAGDQDPGEVGADDAFDDLVDADLSAPRGPRGRCRGCRRRRARARRATRRPRLPAPAGAGSSEGSFSAGRRGPPSAGRRPAQWAARSPLVAGRGAGDRPLVDRGDLVGDPRPGVALGAVAGGDAHRPQPLGLVVERAAAPRPGAAGRPGGTRTPSTPSVTTSL